MENGTGKDPITEGGERRSSSLSGKGDTGPHHTASGRTKPQTVQTETLAQIPTQTLAEPQKHTRQDTLMNKGKELSIIRRIFHSIKVKLSVSIIQHIHSTMNIFGKITITTFISRLILFKAPCSSGDEPNSASQDEEDTDKGSQDSLACQGTSSQSSEGQKSGRPRHQKSSDHNTSSKYSTVSYRKIRKGNTRQKIDEFESKMNL
uniref:Ermin n=1 Tax=Oncorhynchus mykiss TaxID=8022 RepID=A0A8C7UIJ0_ONCMY